jgi:hypothetical protein
VPTWLIIVLAALAALIIVLALLGALGQRRRMQADAPAFDANLEKVNDDLAAAHAADRGWEPTGLDAAARRIYAEQQGSEPSDLTLVAVIDQPGTDQDKAVFRVRDDGAERRLTLGRRDGEWVLDSLA